MPTTNPHADYVTNFVDHFSARALDNETKAREALSHDLGHGLPVTPHLMEAVLKAQSEAAPWRTVQLAMEQGRTATEALREVRRDIAAQLLEEAETQSTSAMANEQRRQDREGRRRFLHDTKGVLKAA